MLEACGGLDSERNPQVQMEAERLTWVRLDLEVKGKCGPTIQMLVLRRSRWGLRRPKITNIITKAECVGNPDGHRQLRCDFEILPGEVSTVVICCSAANSSVVEAVGEGASTTQGELASDKSQSEKTEQEDKKKGSDDLAQGNPSTTVATFKLFITTTLPFSRAPILLLPREPIAARSKVSPKMRLQRRTLQIKKAMKGPFDRKSGFRRTASCQICGAVCSKDRTCEKNDQESNKDKTKSGLDSECVCGCPHRCLCWWWRDAPQAKPQKPEAVETAPNCQSVAAETLLSHQAAKANIAAAVELFSTKCTAAAENTDDKVCRFIEDICAPHHRNMHLNFNNEARNHLLRKARDSHATLVGFTQRLHVATGLHSRSSRARIMAMRERR